MRRHHNPNKVPPFKPDPEHWTRKVHSWKAKVAYETDIMMFGTKFDIVAPVADNHKIDINSDIEMHGNILNNLHDTYIKKNRDYGNAFSEMYDELGINYGYGKIREKVNRIKTLKDNEAQVANEPLEDALLDCANYCILTLMEYQKRKEHGTD